MKIDLYSCTAKSTTKPPPHQNNPKSPKNIKQEVGPDQQLADGP